MTITTAQSPFRTKADIRRAMVVGSTWEKTLHFAPCWVDDCVGTCEWCTGCPEACRLLTIVSTGVVVRATTTSRWIQWDDAHPAAQPTWFGVSGSDARTWTVLPDGFYRVGGAMTPSDPSEERWRYIPGDCT